MSKKNVILGRQGEDLAVSFLLGQGYKVLRRNFRTRMGEIDVIALDQGTYCFIEVKTRASSRFGLPQEAVSFFKQRQMAKAAICFLQNNNLLEKKARFDILCVLFEPGGPRMNLIKNAFELPQPYVV